MKQYKTLRLARMSVILALSLLAVITSLMMGNNAYANSDTVTVCITDEGSDRECDFTTLQAAVNHIHANSGINKIRILSSLPAESTETTIANVYPGRNISFICGSKSYVLSGDPTKDMIKGGSLLSQYRFEGCTFDTANRILMLQGQKFTLVNNSFNNGAVSVGQSMATHTIDSNIFNNAVLAPRYGNFNIFNNVFMNRPVGISISSGGQFNVWHNTFDSLTHGLHINHGATSVKNTIVSNTYSFITQNTGTINSSNTLVHNVKFFRQGAPGGGTDTNIFKGDPLYVDSELRIAKDSPAVGMGLVTSVTLDRDGNKRDGAPDLGAYEVQFLSGR
ncbi:MAG: hypothetical protein QY318_00895 [Candidatus Dojkabacteria bacterium]|nr:MAG: hypothetical protein QY318_00895 [Candidatus Dojkabacteria bacterium]